jgi:hypothetical protein
MRKLIIATILAAGFTGATAGSAQAADYPAGPCETQQRLFETANIQMDMYIPYSREICARTG